MGSLWIILPIASKACIELLNWLNVIVRVKEGALVGELAKLLAGIALNCANVRV